MNFDFANRNYDKCSILGNCAQEPYANFVNEYIVDEICDLVFYIQNLKKMNFRNEALEKELISVLAEINLNFEYHTDTLIYAIKKIMNRKKEVEEFYSRTCRENKKHIKLPQKSYETPQEISIAEIARRGERLFQKRQSLLSEEENTLYTIYLLLIKNLAKNLNEILNYQYDVTDEVQKFFEACNLIREYQKGKSNYLKSIKDLYNINYEITNKKYSIYLEKYGAISQKALTFSSKKNKCIMISGKSLKALDELLDAVKAENIDVYTHNGMIIAHQYKKFAQNKQLVGQYQKSESNIKYDFATFPGPIIIGETQQNKFDGVYRGNLFTTNRIAPFGVSFIENANFEEVIHAAKTSKGFKKGQSKDTLQIGYNESEIEAFLRSLSSEIKAGKYKSILFIGLLHNKIDNADYYKKLVKNLKENTFVISLAHDLEFENSKHFPTYYDYNLALKIFKYLYEIKKECEFKINVYITDCTSLITPNIMMLNYFQVKNIFMPVCRKLPNTNVLEDILKKHFNTHITTYNLEEDLSILNSKDL